MKLTALTLTALLSLALSGCALRRHHTFVDKTQTDLACKLVQEDNVDVRCRVVITDTQKW